MRINGEDIKVGDKVRLTRWDGSDSAYYPVMSISDGKVELGVWGGTVGYLRNNPDWEIERKTEYVVLARIAQTHFEQLPGGAALSAEHATERAKDFVRKNPTRTCIVFEAKHEVSYPLPPEPTVKDL